jgi:hypothetical protein
MPRCKLDPVITEAQLLTPAGWQVKDDGSGNLGFVAPSGTVELNLLANGAIAAIPTIPQNASMENQTILSWGVQTGTKYYIGTDQYGAWAVFTNNNEGFSQDGTGATYSYAATFTILAGTALGNNQALINAGTQVKALLGTDGAGNLRIDADTFFPAVLVNTPFQFQRNIKGVNAIATDGATGVPVVYKTGGPQHNTNAAPASVTYTPPATAGMYRLFIGLLVKTGTTISLTIKVTYTGADGTGKTDVLVFQKENSTTLLTAVVAADRYVADHVFLVDNSGGAITIADNSGTYTTCEYYYQPTIEQMA